MFALAEAPAARAADGDDEDGDGLSNAREQELGTNPSRMDTDGDYLTDGDEVARGTNPKQADSDLDGLPDYSEVVVHRTNPLLKDTDGGGSIDAEEVLVDGTNPTSTQDDHLDSDDDGLSNQLERVLGTDSFMKDSDHDLLSDGAEDKNHDGKLNDDETDPMRADSDGDGVSDGLEVLVYHSDPFAEDSDGDGLDDGWEARYAAVSSKCADPLDLADAPRDPDHDGLSNRQEYASWLRTAAGMREVSTNPCTSDTDDDGLDDPTELHSDYGSGQTDPAASDTDADGLSA